MSGDQGVHGADLFSPALKEGAHVAVSFGHGFIEWCDLQTGDEMLDAAAVMILARAFCDPGFQFAQRHDRYQHLAVKKAVHARQDPLIAGAAVDGKNAGVGVDQIADHRARSERRFCWRFGSSRTIWKSGSRLSRILFNSLAL